MTRASGNTFQSLSKPNNHHWRFWYLQLSILSTRELLQQLPHLHCRPTTQPMSSPTKSTCVPTLLTTITNYMYSLTYKTLTRIKPLNNDEDIEEREWFEEVVSVVSGVWRDEGVEGHSTSRTRQASKPLIWYGFRTWQTQLIRENINRVALCACPYVCIMGQSSIYDKVFIMIYMYIYVVIAKKVNKWSKQEEGKRDNCASTKSIRATERGPSSSQCSTYWWPLGTDRAASYSIKGESQSWWERKQHITHLS